MEEKVKRVLTDSLQISISEFTPELSIQNHVNWDSLSHLKIIVSLEEEFNVKFSDEEMLELTSYEEILKTLRKKNIT
jgi:acyl carrier protein